jgi:serine protease Do
MMNRDSFKNRFLMTALACALVGSAIGLTRAEGDAADRAVAPAPAEQLSSAFTSAARRVGPSVVNIVAVDHDQVAALPREFPGGGGDRFPDLFGDEGLRRFFDQMRPDLRPQAQQTPGRPGGPERRGQGTGFVARADGYIVTNNHVVAGAEALVVTLQDGREYDAVVVGTDAESDVAVLRIEAGDLDPVVFGESDGIETGEWVIAVGSPFGLQQTVTAGIVSATGRSGMGLATFENFIQTDAAINPGNSGGPLVNLRGEVVGMNTAISTRNGGNLGIGFAIPSHMVRTVSDSIIDHGRVSRGWLGVQIQPLTDDLARTFGLDTAEGVLIADVVAEGPSAEAGLEAGDIVTAVDGNKVASTGELLGIVAQSAPGTQLALTIVHEGAERTVRVALGERPGSEAQPTGQASPHTPSADLGLAVEPLTEEAADRPGGVKSGVVASAIDPGGPAAACGLRQGDVILKVGATAVADPRAFWSALSREDLTAGARLHVMRGGLKHFLILKSPSE